MAEWVKTEIDITMARDYADLLSQFKKVKTEIDIAAARDYADLLSQFMKKVCSEGECGRLVFDLLEL